jgi:ATP-dependent DNA ligase
MLNNDLSVALTFVAFDLLGVDGTELTDRTYCERRDLLVASASRLAKWTRA